MSFLIKKKLFLSDMALTEREMTHAPKDCLLAVVWRNSEAPSLDAQRDQHYSFEEISYLVDHKT